MALPALSFFPVRALRQRPLVPLGFAAYICWVDLILCFEGILRDEVNEAGGLVHDPVFLGTTLGAAVALFLAGVLDARRPGAPKPRASRGPAVAGGAVGCLLTVAATLLASLYPNAPRALLYPLGAAVGACFALFTLAWGRKLAGLDLRAALLAVSAAACLQWAAFVPFSLTGVAGHLAAAALPLLSAAALVADRPAQAPEHPRAVAGGSPEASNTRHVLARLAAGAALVAFAIQLVWGFSIKMLPGHLDTGLFGALFVLVTVVIVAVALLCVLVMERQRSYRLELYYRTACGLCLLGAAAVGLAEISSSQAGIFSTYALTYVGHALIGLTVWLLVLGCVSMGAVPQSKAVGVVFGANYLGVFAGFVCVELLASGAGADGASGVPAAVVVFVAVGAIALVYLAVFPERTLLALAPQLFGLSPIGIEERCEKVAREAGLTPRETQVLALLARGRDVAYICDELSIARNTVNVHRKGIYSKLGIHSQQELLDLVERAGQE